MAIQRGNLRDVESRPPSCHSTKELPLIHFRCFPCDRALPEFSRIVDGGKGPCPFQVCPLSYPVANHAIGGATAPGRWSADRSALPDPLRLAQRGSRPARLSAPPSTPAVLGIFRHHSRNRSKGPFQAWALPRDLHANRTLCPNWAISAIDASLVASLRCADGAMGMLAILRNETTIAGVFESP